MPFILALLLLTGSGHAADWPHWRGPNRNGTTPEDSRWSRHGWPPKEVWRKNVGTGSTSPLVVRGRVYTMGWKNGADSVVCLDAATGSTVWRVSYRCPQYGRHAVGDQGSYGGPTSTPEYDRDTGYLYTLSVDGDLNCWDTRRRGRRVWGMNLYDRYHMPPRPAVPKTPRRDYGYTTAPLVYRNWLLVEVGGKAGTIVAFDKRTGRQRWTSQAHDLAGHTGGPALMTVAGTPCLATLTFNGLLVVRLDKGHEGQTAAHYPYQTEWANTIAGPAVAGNEVLITSGYNHQTITKVRVSLTGVRKVWEQKHVYSKVCTPVIYHGKAYWSWMNVFCLDMTSGKVLWKGRSGGSDGSCILTADQRLLVWANKGDLLLVETAERSPHAFKVLARVKRLFRTEVWPHLALADGRLFCKDRAGNLACLQLGGG